MKERARGKKVFILLPWEQFWNFFAFLKRVFIEPRPISFVCTSRSATAAIAAVAAQTIAIAIG